MNALVGLLQDVGVPYFSILTDPTFGGTSASLALVADINLAEPGCSIGFTGARVIRQATHTDLPPDFQTAEFQLERGQVDMVVSRLDLRARLVELLQLYRDATALRSRGRSRPRGPAGRQAGRSWPRAAQEADDAPRGWPLVTLARHPERPYAKDYIQRWADRFVEVHGDRLVGDDHALVGGIGRWNGVPTMFLGQQKARTFAERVRCNFGMMHPEGYRKAMRLARQAARFGFPIVVLLDTPGAYPGAGAEERGMAGAIASAITEWFRIGTPVVAAVIGEGGSGGALGLGVADRVLMMEHAIYSVASPEAAASIVWRDSAKKEAAAEQFRLSAADMVRLGVADTVVPEPPGGAHTDPNMAAELLGAAVQETLRELIDAPAEELLANRHRRFRGMGNQMLDRGPRLETAGTTAATATPAGEG